MARNEICIMIARDLPLYQEFVASAERSAK